MNTNVLKQEAIASGRAEGLQQASAELIQQKEELTKWMALLQKPVQLLDDRLTQENIQTVIWLCQHCIGVELSVHPDKLRTLIDKIKEELPSLQGNNLFAMHPSDVAWIKEKVHEKEIPGLHEILYADPALGQGDFYLKSDQSELDGRLHTRLITLFAKYINKDNLNHPY